MKSTLQTINEYAQNDPAGLVEKAENHYDREITETAQRIADDDSLKIVAIAGPSASGKTTTAHILSEKLQKLGEQTEVVSLDDFYLPTEQLPLTEDGKYDIESVNALDKALMKKCFGEIISTGRTELPKYNFAEKRRILSARSIDISGKGLVIVEGLHALNPVITELVPRKNIFKAYISVNRSVLDDNGDILLTSRQIRLMRRVLRDRIFRGSSVNETLALWKGVVEGEKKYLYCFKDTADVLIKTLHIYEPCLYRNDFCALCDETQNITDCRDYFLKTAEAVRKFVPLDEALIPHNSLIREFIGEGKYN